MSITFGNFTICFTNIFDVKADVIVNPSNPGMHRAGGMDGMIHDRAGPGLEEFIESIRDSPVMCPTGTARVTPGFDVGFRHIIFTVGPDIRDDPVHTGHVKLLKAAYKSSLDLARCIGAKSIVFPCISTGIYRFPKDIACNIAGNFLIDYSNKHGIQVTMSVFDKEEQEIWREWADAMDPGLY